ncbi:MAG: mitochondrial fission ELM1 family protein [Alphaproteobacteria bacterium]|nr:mitochondrial fission ELM1 family protein [Alphaproteobacteria bacterium]
MVRPTNAWLLSEDYAGLWSQATGLAEAAGLSAERRVLVPRGIFRVLSPKLWPRPQRAIAPQALAPPLPEIVIGCGGKAAAVLATLHGVTRTVIIQHPRMDPRRFDLIVAARHDELEGPNVFVTRTALHRATPARLAAAAPAWAPRFADLPRPLVAVLLGGSNGRFRLDRAAAAALAERLAGMMAADRVGLAITPSRRTDPAAVAALSARLRPRGAYLWDGTGENPYFGMLGLADAIVVTTDSVSMISEAVATAAPVMVAALPGRSRRIALFLRGLIDAGRVRPYEGRFAHWRVAPLDDTPAAAAELVRRFGY